MGQALHFLRCGGSAVHPEHLSHAAAVAVRDDASILQSQGNEQEILAGGKLLQQRLKLHARLCAHVAAQAAFKQADDHVAPLFKHAGHGVFRLAQTAPGEHSHNHNHDEQNPDKMQGRKRHTPKKGKTFFAHGKLCARGEGHAGQPEKRNACRCLWKISLHEAAGKRF